MIATQSEGCHITKLEPNGGVTQPNINLVLSWQKSRIKVSWPGSGVLIGTPVAVVDEGAVDFVSLKVRRFSCDARN